MSGNWIYRCLSFGSNQKLTPVKPEPQPVMPYVCVYHHLVTVKFMSEAVMSPSNGLSESQKVECHHHLVWHRDVFCRDDVMDNRMLRGFIGASVTPVIRRYLPADAVRLENWDDRTMVVCPNGEPNGFFAGFAPNLLAAMTYVAKGERSRLVTPW